jgi:hypothetical protein
MARAFLLGELPTQLVMTCLPERMSRKKHAKIKVVWEHVEDPDALEKLGRAYELICRQEPKQEEGEASSATGNKS